MDLLRLSLLNWNNGNETGIKVRMLWQKLTSEGLMVDRLHCSFVRRMKLAWLRLSTVVVWPEHFPHGGSDDYVAVCNTRPSLIWWWSTADEKSFSWLTLANFQHYWFMHCDYVVKAKLLNPKLIRSDLCLAWFPLVSQDKGCIHAPTIKPDLPPKRLPKALQED